MWEGGALLVNVVGNNGIIKAVIDALWRSGEGGRRGR